MAQIHIISSYVNERTRPKITLFKTCNEWGPVIFYIIKKSLQRYKKKLTHLWQN